MVGATSCLGGILPDNGFGRHIEVHLHDHISAVSNNLKPDAPRTLDRSAFQRGLSEASVLELQLMAEQEGMAVLKKLYARAVELSAMDREQNAASHHFRIGLYSYSEKETGKGVKKGALQSEV